MFNIKKLCVAVAAVVCSSSVFSEPVVTFVQANTNVNGVVPTSVSTVRSTYLAEFTSFDSYGFETALSGDNAAAVGPISFQAGLAGTIKATLGGDGAVRSANNGGRINTTPGGRNYWEAKAGINGGNTAGNFSLTFDQGISAFSFYGSDIGDFEGTMSIILTKVGGGSTTIVFNDAANPAATGNLLFFGFIDREFSYSKIVFQTSATSTTSDFFGFDDFTVVDKSQIRVINNTPEPGSLALAGLALVAAGGVLRKRKAA